MTIRIEGLRELQEQLKEVGDALTQRKVLRAAARKAFKPVLDEAISRAPIDTGALKESMRLASVNPKKGDAVVVVGLEFRKSKDKKDAGWRWHFPEFGTVKQDAKPYIRPAFDNNVEAVTRDLKEQLKKGIAKALKKKKGGRR